MREFSPLLKCSLYVIFSLTKDQTKSTMQQAIVQINSSRDDIDKSGIENITLENITVSQTLSQKNSLLFYSGSNREAAKCYTPDWCALLLLTNHLNKTT